jgi:patatin-like phospholipase/acyl hydrolase
MLASATREGREAGVSTYRVLALDGGGIRGVVTTVLLQRIAAMPGLERFLDSVDLVAGTSTGGLIALGIAGKVGLDLIRDMYVREGPRIFDDSWLDDLADLGKLGGADYDIGRLRRALQALFGEATLGDLDKRVLITAFDLDNEDPTRRTWKPKLFHNFPGANSDRRELAYKVGLYTTAAPTYFPSVDGYIDGGVYASNPSMCALAQTQDARYAPTPPIDDVVLLSIGTGTSLQYIRGKSHDWGYAQWVEPLIRLMLDGTTGIADYQCSQMLGPRYHRLAPTFPPDKAIPLDDVEQVPFMERFASELRIDATLRWIRETWSAA